MENFVWHNPTILHFGKGIVNTLNEFLHNYGENVLLVYGQGSVKKNNAYNDVINQLRIANKKIFEYSGIKSNPVINDVNDAAAICKKNNINFIIAVGGGSVIDSAKIISLAAVHDIDAWDIVSYKTKPIKNIPLIAVLTLAATGTEMNGTAVIQNNLTKEKIGFKNKLIYPQHSFLDPSYTLSVPKNYTAYGIVDIISHVLEAFFGYGDASLSDRFAVSVIKETIEYGKLLINDLTNYNYRSNIMYASTCALNGMLSIGRAYGDWGTHAIGHCLSVLYDIPHGATLSIVFPAWMIHNKEKIENRLLYLGKEIFNVNSSDETINNFISFFKEIGAPVSLSELNIPNFNKQEFIGTLIKNKATGFNIKLTYNDYLCISNLIMA